MSAKAMTGKLVLVHWDEKEANSLAAELRAACWQVRFGVPELKQLKAHPPDAVVISLRRLPSHGREVADAIWYTKWGREMPIVFFDGEPDKVEATRKEFPAALFTTWGALRATLESLAQTHSATAAK